MSIRFQADKSFVNYITMIGFQRRQVDSDKEYYTNNLGNQIKIDNETGLISLLNKKGNTVDFANVFTNVQIDEFSKSKGE